MSEDARRTTETKRGVLASAPRFVSLRLRRRSLNDPGDAPVVAGA
ncbi:MULTISPECIES: hypothetical protein [unclassified Microbacterium]|nr:hypothetical protein [Microbacterium sp. USTB-Y]